MLSYYECVNIMFYLYRIAKQYSHILDTNNIYFNYCNKRLNNIVRCRLSTYIESNKNVKLQNKAVSKTASLLHRETFGGGLSQQETVNLPPNHCIGGNTMFMK